MAKKVEPLDRTKKEKSNPVERKMLKKHDLTAEDFERAQNDPDELIAALSKKYNLPKEVVEIEIAEWLSAKQR